MSDMPPRIGDLIERYRAFVISGTASGYVVQRRAKGSGGAGPVYRARNVAELARVLAELNAADDGD